MRTFYEIDIYPINWPEAAKELYAKENDGEELPDSYYFEGELDFIDKEPSFDDAVARQILYAFLCGYEDDDSLLPEVEYTIADECTEEDDDGV